MTQRGSAEPVVDQELWEAVRRIVDDETHELVADGRLTVNEHGSAEMHPEGWIEILPSSADASPLSLDVWDDTVAFGPGRNGACLEIWTRADSEWDSELRLLIRCVKNGRYSERVRRGWVFALKVRMRFEGVRDKKGRTYTPSYASLPEPQEQVRTGEHRYPAWLTARLAGRSGQGAEARAARLEAPPLRDERARMDHVHRCP